MSSDMVRARLDAAGGLIYADHRLAELNARAGGAIGRPLAIPALAAAARLALRLRVPVSRAGEVAEGANTLSLWIRARPDDAGVSLELSGWTRSDEASARQAAASRAEAAWTCEIDAALRIEGVGIAQGQSLLGERFTRMVRLEEEEDGRLPMLEAIALHAPFDDQRAVLRSTGEAISLSGVPRAGGGWRITGRHLSSNVPGGGAEALAESLRRPLSRILRGAEGMAAERGSRYGGYAEDIVSAARHLLAIVEDLAALEEVEDEQLKIPVERVDLAAIARRATALMAIRAGEAGVRMEPPADDVRLAACGEARRATQILVNLIGNALRHSPAGGAVRITGEDDGDEAVILVSDDGPGIAPADHARIFERFERLGLRDAEGSGLGLYIARRLARAMGGEVKVASSLGSGASFALRLPIG